MKGKNLEKYSYFIKEIHQSFAVLEMLTIKTESLYKVKMPSIKMKH